MTTEKRFWAKVERRGEEECWPWTACQVRGYGQFKAHGSRRVYAHRFAYELLIGPVPAGLTIDHLCRNRSCVNPAHMEPVPSAVNTLRGNNPLAKNARKTHCKRGHKFTPENTYRSRKGRECLTCRRMMGARRYQMKDEA